MNCKECADFLMDYLDGNLPAAQADAFKQHLERCPPCVTYLETYQHCIQLGRVCVEDDSECGTPPPEEMVRAILDARKQT